jgi:hypothetical protein
MKKTKVNRKIVLLTAILFFGQLCAQTPIPATFFGHNYWFTDYSSAPTGGVTSFSNTIWDYATETGAKMMRVGGNGYNVYTDVERYPHTGLGADAIITPAGYVTIVDDIRARGFEPMITVPFEMISLKKSIAEQAGVAAEIVRQLNVVHKRKVKYFIVSNEPGEDQGIYASATASTISGSDIRLIRDYIRKFSVEMKKVDATIKIIGPELEWHVPKLLDSLFCATTSTTGNLSVRWTIGNDFEGVNTTTAIANLYFVDYLSFHSYPASGGVFGTYTNTRKAMIEAVRDYTANYQNIYDSYIACPSNTTQNRTGTLKVALDEFNMGIDVPGPVYSATTNADVSDETNKNANSFLAGQMVVDLMGAMLSAKEGTSNITPFEISNVWSLAEREHTALTHSNTTVRKPTYWHYWLMSNFFKGSFYSYSVVPSGSTNIQRGIKAYACNAGNYIAVIAMNQLQGTTSNTIGTYNSASVHPIAIGFNSVVPSNTTVANFKFDMGKSFTLTADIENSSTSLFILNCNGSVTCRYDLKQSAITNSTLPNYSLTPALGSPPTTPSVTGSGTVCAGGGGSITLTAPSGTVLNWYRLPDLANSVGSLSTLAANEGLYQVNVTGSCGATYFATGYVYGVSPYISLTQTAGIAQFCSGTSAVISASVANTSSVTWAPTTSLSPTSGVGTHTVAANPSSGETYTATVTDASSCTASDRIRVTPSYTLGLYVKDDAADIGAEPNNTLPGGLVFWNSPHIWVTQTSSTVGPTSHTNAEYKQGGDPNYVHVRISNGSVNDQSGLLYLYWVKGGTATTWSVNWVNNVQGGLIYGDQIGNPIPITVSGGTNNTTDIEVPWYPPNPSSYTVDMHHFCLLARVVTGCALATQTNVWGYTREKNRVAWRNIEVRNDNTQNKPVYTPEGYLSNVRVLNTYTANTEMRFELAAIQNSNNVDFFDYGEAVMYMAPGLYAEWGVGGSQGTSFTDLGNDAVRLKANPSGVSNITMTASEYFDVDMQFTFYSQPALSVPFEVDLVQYNTSVLPEECLGGMRYYIIPPSCPTVAVEDALFQVCGTGCASFAISNPTSSIQYTWYDNTHTISVGTGSTVTVCPGGVDATFWVDAAQNGCIASQQLTVTANWDATCTAGRAPMKDDAIVSEEQELNDMIKFHLAPNPTNERTIVSYRVGEGQKGILQVTDAIGKVVMRGGLLPGDTKVGIDCRPFKNGIYYVSLILDNRTVRTLKMIVMK